ncbi:MAG: DUF4340 domain-containing protein [Pedosphaera sp.]|nr:DUF4340 domain-containing protein [Pedosphaera sp.]
MNTKQLALLVAVGVALGGGGIYVRSRHSSSFKESSSQLGGAVLAKLDASTLSGLRITSGTNHLNLLKLGEEWVVAERGNFPANFTSIGEFVRKLIDLKVTQPVQVGPSRLAALELLPPDKCASVLVELIGSGGKSVHSLLLGKKVSKEGKDDSGMGGGGWPIGRYIMLDGKTDSIALVNEPLANAEPKAEDWLEKEWFKVEQPIALSLSHAEITNSFALSRTNEFSEWSLTGIQTGEKLDTSKAGAFSTLLSAASFDDVLVNPQPTSLGLDTPLKASIRTASGWSYEVRVGKVQDGEKYPIQYTVSAEIPSQRQPSKDEKKEDAEKLDKTFNEKLKLQKDKLATEQARSKWTYLVSKWSIDPLFKKRSDLFVDPKAAATPPGEGQDASPIDLQGLQGLQGLPGKGQQ